MKIYKIVIGTHTTKGKFQEHTSILVKSILDITKIKNHFTRQYQGMVTNVCEVTDNVIEIKEEKKKKKTVNMYDSEIKESGVTAEYKKKWSHCDDVVLKMYKASVHYSDLPRWKEFDEKQNCLKEKINELRNNYEKFVKESFKEIKTFGNFKIESSGVRFEFNPSSFNLELKAQIETNVSVEDLPF